MNEETKIVVFEYHKGWNNVDREEMEFDIDADDEEIEAAFEDWVWQKIGDLVTWYEKEEK